MAPFGDAMSFVNGDACELTLRIDGLKAASEGLGQGVLWGDVKETRMRVTWIETVIEIRLS